MSLPSISNAIINFVKFTSLALNFPSVELFFGFLVFWGFF